MNKDAKFEDSVVPLKLRATTVKDLEIVSALLQDSIIQAKDLTYLRKTSKVALVLSRYCWENKTTRQRVRTGLHFDHVISLKVRGLSQEVPDKIFSVLSLSFSDNNTLQFACSENIDIRVHVSGLDVMVQDISRPWTVSHIPQHKVT